jgi:uncharacterized protein (TIGR03067 family)
MPQIHSLFAVALVFAVAPAFADDKSDMKALAGTWKVEKAEIDGKDQTEIFKAFTLVVEDGKYTADFGGPKDIGTVAIDSSKKPKTMDIVGTDGVNKGKKYPSIYELKGDTVIICYSLDEKVRPEKFETKAESKTMLVTYKREKK